MTKVYVLRNSVSGFWFGMRKPVAERPDAREYETGQYRDAVAKARELGKGWFVEVETGH